MPIHDWSRVDAGIFHHFHQAWIGQIARVLNEGLLPGDYYALAEQFVAGLGPDVLTLQGTGNDNGSGEPSAPSATAVRPAAPKLQPVAETDMAFYRRKQSVIVVRHTSDDRVVAILEIVSPGNEGAQHPFQAFVQKAADFIEAGVHLLIVDLHRPGRRDPEGIHAAIWDAIDGEAYYLPEGKPLTVAAYESGDRVRAYVVHTAIGEPIAEMPLFLEPGLAVSVPLEATYQAAFAEVPRRWQRVLAAA
ncbi:MAG TPA: DUF4058 family protein [Pirellulales bacterium]|nr:DUF4058 family protein [Pirellulales bacterium]